MNRNSARFLAQNPQILKRRAKYMAQHCSRNTVLEDFYAGITPYSEAGDYSRCRLTLESQTGLTPDSRRYLTCIPINAKKFQDFSHVALTENLRGRA